MTQTWETSLNRVESDYDERFNSLIARIEFDTIYEPAAREAIHWYSARLPYHNIEHMFEVTENVLLLCDQRGVVGPARQALCMAALWHDAAYPFKLEDDGVSKEHRSAGLAREAILRLSVTDDSEDHDVTEFADFVSRLIISTHKDIVPSDIYEEILNEADIMNLFGTQVQMLQKSTAFFVEGLLLEGEEFVGTLEEFIANHTSDLQIWCPKTRRILAALTTNKVTDPDQLKAVLDNIPRITFGNILGLVRANDESD